MTARVVGLSNTRVSACRYARQRMDGWRWEGIIGIIIVVVFIGG